MSAGTARLAGEGLKGWIKQAARGYLENDLASTAVQVGLDLGLNMLQGVDPLTATTSAIGTGVGSFGGKNLGRMFTKPGTDGRILAEALGDQFGGIGGGTLGTFVPSLLKIDTSQTGEPMRSPDSAQQDPRMVQMQQQQAMMQQGLTPEQLRKMQERAARRAAEAQYQAAALQQYGGQQAYGGMY